MGAAFISLQAYLGQTVIRSNAILLGHTDSAAENVHRCALANFSLGRHTCYSYIGFSLTCKSHWTSQ